MKLKLSPNFRKSLTSQQFLYWTKQTRSSHAWTSPYKSWDPQRNVSIKSCVSIARICFALHDMYRVSVMKSPDFWDVLKLDSCLWFRMGVKLGHWHYGRNVEWRCLITGCWGEHLHQRRMKCREVGKKYTFLIYIYIYIYINVTSVHIWPRESDHSNRTWERFVGSQGQFFPSSFSYRILSEKHEEKKCCEDLDIDGKTILKRILEK
jgi:hypothetical protein